MLKHRESIIPLWHRLFLGTRSTDSKNGEQEKKQELSRVRVVLRMPVCSKKKKQIKLNCRAKLFLATYFIYITVFISYFWRDDSLNFPLAWTHTQAAAPQHPNSNPITWPSWDEKAFPRNWLLTAVLDQEKNTSTYYFINVWCLFWKSRSKSFWNIIDKMKL